LQVRAPASEFAREVAQSHCSWVPSLARG
jgi:hypothetical protein